MIAAIPLAAGAAMAAGPVLSAMALAIKALYGITGEINDFLDRHIVEMKGSENPTVSRTGRVLEMAKFGFGIGYMTSVVVIAVGQLLLGNTLAAVGTVATAATLTNPIAMTCAAFGAIYYGWNALSDIERNELLEKLSKGLEIGTELIKSIVQFVVSKTKELFSSKSLVEIKKYIGSAAAVFGKTLGDVTRTISDRAKDAAEAVKKKAKETGETFSENVDFVAGKTIDTATNTGLKVSKLAEKTKDGFRKLSKPASKSK
jgi:hypothetical protein